MGRIKDLRAKVAKGEATDDEKTELTELETEATPDPEPTPDPETTDEDVEAAAEKMANAITSKVTSSIDSLTAQLKAASAPPTVKVEESKFIVDKALGKVGVEDLDAVKIALPNRKAQGKQVTEVTGKTVHFLHALLTSDKQKLQTLTEGTAAAGGYLVPEEFANMIVEDIRDATVMRQLANVIPVNTDTFHLPKLDSRPQAQWRSEGAVKATSTAQFSEIVLTPYSLAAIVGLSRELSADATLGVNGSIVNYIAGLMVQALAEKEDRAFWAGSGSGQPTGVNTYSVGSIATGGTDANHADSIQQLYWRLPQGYRNRAVWVGHRSVWEKVATLKDSQNRYLLTGLADSPTPVLKGRPVYEQNDLASSELYLGDFSYYVIADREGISVDTSEEATVAGQSAFERNLIFVRVEKRVDGELTHTQGVRKITNF